MKTYMSMVAAVGLVAVGLVTTAAAQPALPEVVSREYSCMHKSTKYGSKLIGASTECVVDCFAHFWINAVPETDCLPPYGGATADCRAAAEAKFPPRIEKGCRSDCPECYGTCGPSQAVDTVLLHGGAGDSFVPGIYCERAGATSQERRCQRETALAFAKQHYSVTKCFKRCLNKKRKRGGVPTCMPPVTDPDTLECLAKASTIAADTVERYCDEGREPDCGGYPTGAQWAFLTQLAVESFVPEFYCASPSGAFVD